MSQYDKKVSENINEINEEKDCVSERIKQSNNKSFDKTTLFLNIVPNIPNVISVTKSSLLNDECCVIHDKTTHKEKCQIQMNL